MAVTIGRFNNNLINPSSWTAGNGGVGVFNANGDATEQNRYVGTDPWGNSAMVWQTVPSGNNQADGGWNTSGVAIDQNSLYRFSVWVRRTSATSGGTFYFGIQSSTGNTIQLTGTTDGNPYWSVRGTGSLAQNQWYLVVGHCFPWFHNGTIRHVQSGWYTTSGGTTKVSDNEGSISMDCKWTNGTTTGVHRTYHYYCADSTTRLEFYMPRIDKVDGTEPSLSQLLSGPIADGISFSNGTAQTSTGPATGRLISVVSFTNNGTWTKPTGCTKVHVKVVGGGGGAAGYCESGGAGGYSEALIDVTSVSSVAVTVGGGGWGSGYYSASSNGGTSSFGSYCSASGGYGANQNYSHSGGHGGSGSGGQLNIQGAAGRGHTNSVGSWSGGNGGWSYFGGGACHIRNHGNLGNGLVGKVYRGAPGSGAPGAMTDGAGYAQHGGAGEPGYVIVYSYT